METQLIKGVVKDYAWGNDYYLASLLNLEKNGPKAEYWMGCHPSGEATLVEKNKKLSEYIKEKGEDALGEGRKELPLLFKVLAIEKPLSIQCHPTKEQAEEGWKREEELRKLAKEYNYQDDNSKPEIICALSPITALCGFRTIKEAEENFNKYVPSFFNHRFGGAISSIKDLFLSLNRLEKEEKIQALDEVNSVLSHLEEHDYDGPYLTTAGIIRECLKEYPGDIGALAPLYMNVVRLKEGDALYLKPDTLHAYLKGNGVELMNSSDNVLRGGLTKKRIDLKELERIMDFSSYDAKPVNEEKDEEGRIHFKTESKDFELVKLEKGSYSQERECAIIIAISENVEIKEGEESLALGAGECAFIPYSAKAEIIVYGLAFEAIIPR